MSEVHYKLGIPEFVPQEEVDEAYAALNPEVPNEEPEVNASHRVEGLKAAARFYWAKSFVEMTNRNFRAMRESAKIADDYETWATPLVAAIFDYKEAPERVLEMSKSITIEDASLARSKVKAEISRFKEQPKKETKKETKNTSFKVQESPKVPNGLKIGQVVVVKQFYRCGKNSPCFATYHDIEKNEYFGIKVEEIYKPILDGRKVRIVKVGQGCTYGRRYDATAVLVDEV